VDYNSKIIFLPLRKKSFELTSRGRLVFLQG